MGKDLLKIVTPKRNAYCEAKGLRPKERYWFHPHHSTTDTMFVMSRLQELERIARVLLFPCFISLLKAYDSVDRTLLWQVLAHFGVPPREIRVICQFHHGMRACVRSDDDQRSEFKETPERVKTF